MSAADGGLLFPASRALLKEIKREKSSQNEMNQNIKFLNFTFIPDFAVAAAVVVVAAAAVAVGQSELLLGFQLGS